MVLVKLVLGNVLTQPARTGLTLVAVALAVSLVVAVSSGYASLRVAATEFLEQLLVGADAQVVRRGDRRTPLPEQLIRQLEQDEQVVRAFGRLEMDLRPLDRDGQPILGRALHVIGLARPDDHLVETLGFNEGGWFDTDSADVAVIDQEAATLLEAGVGDTVLLPRLAEVGDAQPGAADAEPLRLRVVGVVHRPTLPIFQTQTVYVPLRTLQRFALPDDPHQVTRILLDLEPGTDADALARRWDPVLAETDPLLHVRPGRETRREIDQYLRGAHIMSYLGSAVSILAATFIIFSALSMGVTERVRILAMMRAVGALRGQVGLLVILEGLLLSGLGVLAGVPLGWLWVNLLAGWFPDFFTYGAVLDRIGVMLAIGVCLLAGLIASLLPAWTAMRVSPLEAMGVLATQAGGSARVAGVAIVGLVLIALDPIILFVPGPLGWDDPLVRSGQFYLHFLIGLPGVMIGFFLLAPAMILVVERLLGPVVSGALRVRQVLLRQQLSGGMWRSAGTAAALMVGLAVLVVQQTQGRTLIGGWRLPDRFPDLLIISMSPGGLPLDQVGSLERIEGIRPGEVTPIAIASPELGASIFAIAGAALMPDSTLFFGIDPDRALDMMDLEFRQGSAEEARELLRQGGHIIVTEEFHVLKGLGRGDTLQLRTQRGMVVDYTIAGVIWSPGLDLMVGVFDMERQFDQRTAGSVFGSIEDARRDFGVRSIHLFAANLEETEEKEAVLRSVRMQLGLGGLFVGDVRRIKREIQSAFLSVLLLASTVAFAAMAVASLGVTNTILASVRSRRWHFGILRSMGLTRGQLLRLVLAEALLLGMVAVGLGLAAGMEMAVNARQFSAVLVGYHPPLVVPWRMIGIGVGVVMGVSVLASLWPAGSVARKEPLSLLAAGRGSI